MAGLLPPSSAFIDRHVPTSALRSSAFSSTIFPPASRSFLFHHAVERRARAIVQVGRERADAQQRRRVKAPCAQGRPDSPGSSDCIRGAERAYVAQEALPGSPPAPRAPAPACTGSEGGDVRAKSTCDVDHLLPPWHSWQLDR